MAQMYFHGGGRVLGDQVTHHRLGRKIADGVLLVDSDVVGCRVAA